MPSFRPTLRSLAARAGVSAMTVSLALRNSREVSAATRRRIHRLAAETGYRPDPTVARLMHHLRTRRTARLKANIAGLIEVWSPQQRQATDYIARLQAGLERRAQELGYAFSTCDLGTFETREQLQRVLLSRGVEGLVVLPLRHNADLADRLDWSQFSAVSATPTLISPRLHSVMPNHYDNMLTACHALQAAGFRRIGLAISREWNQRVKFRWSGGVAWQNEFGETQRVRPLITDAPGPDLDPQEFARWLRRERPDVVITDVLVRAAVASALTALPARARPKVVSMNGPDLACDASMDQRPEQIGAAAIELLTGLLLRGERGLPELPHTTIIDGRWIGGRIAVRRRSSRGS